MDEGTYNNVVRTNSPFSPVTPGSSGAPAYKANVNRTKTRKWVEAKAQSYDGDDWGDESYDDEPEESPPPARPTGVRQPGQSGQLSTTHSSAFMPPPRTFSQPTPANAPQTVVGPRGPSGPVPSPISQNRPPVAAAATGQVPSRFPPRKSSMSSIRQQESSDTADAPAPRTSSRPGSSSSGRPWSDQRLEPPTRAAGPSETPARTVPFVRPADIYRRMGEEKEKQRLSMESGRPSMDSIRSRGDSASPANASRSSIEQRRRTSLDKDDGTPRSPRSTLAPVAERKSEYGLDRLLATAQVEADGSDNVKPQSKPQDLVFAHNQAEPIEDPREDLRHLSISPKLPEVSRLSGFGDDFFSNSIRNSTGAGPTLQPVTESQPARQQQSSVLDGPKLEPNPNIIMSSSGENVPLGTSSTLETPGSQPTPLRPKIPGGWVSETSALSPGPVNTQTSSDNADTSAPDDLEPTTKVKHLSPATESIGSAPEVGNARVPGQDDFGSVVGHHDDAVASKVISAGPGHHPTPHSLPPLKTDDPLRPMDTSRNHDLKSPSESSTAAPPSSINASQPPPDNRSNAATTASAFTPTAPLNSYRLSTSRSDFATENNERKSTTSTIGSASPLKESDKLREEIMKTLSPSPMNMSSSSEAISSATYQEQGGVPRESRYLSGVYDDYLSLAEEKTLLETGRALRNESMLNAQRTTEPDRIEDSVPLMDTSIPEVAPLSPKRTPEPEMEAVKRQRRFSWEQPSETETTSPAATKLAEEAPKESPSHLRQLTEMPTEQESKQSGRGTPSNEPPKPSGGLQFTPDQSSPISISADENLTADMRRSLAEEKVLIESSSHPILEPPQTEHPALSEPPEPSAAAPPTDAETSVNPTVQQPKIMAFREILNLPSSDQRTQKFDETRYQFFNMDSGLSNWLMHMKNQVEQPVATEGDDLQRNTSAAQAQPGPGAMQQSTQQPYYQQYLNASNPDATMPSPRRTSTGNLLAPSGPTTSGFNSGNQVGVKGKELLHAAGAIGNKGMKSGMKLFNKGKNKLRERANDKGKSRVPTKPDATDAATEARARNDHHSSWSISALRERSASTAQFGKGTGKRPATTITPQSSSSRGGHHQHSRSLSSLTSLLFFRPRHDVSLEAPVPQEGPGAIPTARRIADTVPTSHQQQQQQHSWIRQVTNDDTDIKGSATLGVTVRNCYSPPQSSPSSQPHQSQPPPNLVCARRNPCPRPSHRRSWSAVDPPNSTHFPTQRLSPSAQAPTFTSQQKHTADTSTPTSPPQLHRLHLSTPTLVSPSFPSPSLSPIVPSLSRNNNSVTTYSSPPPSSGEVASTGRHYFPQPDLVSPISETRSSTPVPSISNHDEEPQLSALGSRVLVPAHAPIDQYPPSQDLFIAVPLLEEEDSGLDLRDRLDHSFPTPSTVSNIIAHDAWQLTSHKTSAWIEDEQADFSHTDIASVNASRMTARMATNTVNAPAPGDAAQEHSGSPARQSSFVGLPPIRRTSTINFLSRKDDDSSPSPIDNSDNEGPPVPSVPSVPTGLGLQSPDGQISARGQKDHIAFHASPPRSQNSKKPALQQPRNGDQNGYNPPTHQIPDVLLPGRGAVQTAVAHQTGIAPKAQQVLMGRDASSGHQHTYGQVPGQPGPSFPSNQAHPFMSQAGGNPIQRLPPGGQWKLEESHLSEPLISPSRNRSGTSPPLPQPGYFAYDKETGISSGPSQPPQRNKNNSIPPISAQRFPGLFAGPHRPSPQGLPQDQDHAFEAQPPNSSLTRSQTDNIADPGRRGSASDLFKDFGSKFRARGSSVSDMRRADEVSEASDTKDASDLAPPDKKRVFGSADNPHPQSKPRSSLNLVRNATMEPPSGQNHADSPDSPAKKRLSDLKSLFKGNPTAKDDQSAKGATAQPHNSVQGPGEARNTTLPGQQMQQRLPAPMAAGPPGPHDARPPPPVATQSQFSLDSRSSNNEERDKSSGRRIFSNLFGGKSKAQEAKPQPSQQVSQGQRPDQFPGPAHPGQQFHPGQIPPQNQQFAIRQMPPGQSPLQQMTMGSQSQPRPMTSDASSSGQRAPGPLGNFTHTKQLSQASIPQHSQLGDPLGQQQQFGQLQRPNMLPQPAAQSNQRLTPAYDDHHPLHSNPVTPSKQPGDGLAAAGAALNESSKPSPSPSQEPLNPGEAAVATRLTPSRKPVGSGPARQERGSVTSTQSVSTVTQPNSAVSNGSMTGHDRTSSIIQRDDGSATQSSPAQKTTGFGAADHNRQPSLPSPADSPAPQTQSPESSSQSHFTASPKPSGSVQQPAPQGVGVPASQQGRVSSTQEQPGQAPQQNQEKPSQVAAPRLGPSFQQQNPQMTGALPASNEKTVQQKSSKFFRSISPHPQKSPTHSEQPEEPLSPATKLLGPKTKTVIQALPPPQAIKEKSKTSKKIFSAFKRSKQQTASQQFQQSQQQNPQPGHPGQPGQQIPPHMLRPGMPGQPGQPFAGHPQAMQPGQGRGQMIPPHIQAQMQAHMQAHMQAGRGQMPPQMQAGRGQMPLYQMMVGRGQMPPQIPGAPGQFPGQFPGQPHPQYKPSTQHPTEPQYAQVPIPRGYEAVHGYNNPGRLDVSPYDVGRHSANSSPTPPTQPQYQSQPPQGSPGQHWDPRMAPQNPQGTFQAYPAPQPYGRQTVQNEVPPQQLHPNPTHPHSLSSGQPQVGAPQQPQPAPGTTPPINPQNAQASQSPKQPEQPPQTNIIVQAPTPAQQFAVLGNGAVHGRQPSSGAQDSHQANQHVVGTVGAPNNGTQGSSSGGGGPISPENLPRSESAMSFAPINSVARDQSTLSTPSTHPTADIQRPLSDLRHMSSQAATANSSGHDSAGGGGVIEHARSVSLSPDNNVPQDRTLTVSPEPPEHQHIRPLAQQVSNQNMNNMNMNINVQRANQVQHSENIYDATPREPSHLPATAAVAGVAAGIAGAAVMVPPREPSPPGEPSPPEQQPGFYDPSNTKSGTPATDDDYPDDSKQKLAAQPIAAAHPAEPEEKILVDQPVELAAVNDDDDGIPMMSATSYPGQEWNPYGAGEFGDWD